MTIAEVSSKYGLSADTLRYYEKIGLLPAVQRTNGGIRDYQESDCNWIQFIKCMRSAGLSVEALRDYVQLFQQGESTLQERKALLMEQRQLLAARIEELNNTLKKLDDKIEGYEQNVVPCENMLLQNAPQLQKAE